MSVSRIVAIRRSVLKKVCIVALFAVVSFRFAPVIAAADENQDFETWPPTTSWETTMHEGWTLSDGQVKPSRGGFGRQRQRMVGIAALPGGRHVRFALDSAGHVVRRFQHGRAADIRQPG